MSTSKKSSHSAELAGAMTLAMTFSNPSAKLLAEFCEKHSDFARTKLPLFAVEIANETSFLTLFKLLEKRGGTGVYIVGLATASSTTRKERQRSTALEKIVGEEDADRLHELFGSRDTSLGSRVELPSMDAVLNPIRHFLMAWLMDSGLSAPKCAIAFGVHEKTARRAREEYRELVQ